MTPQCPWMPLPASPFCPAAGTELRSLPDATMGLRDCCLPLLPARSLPPPSGAGAPPPRGPTSIFTVNNWLRCLIPV